MQLWLDSMSYPRDTTGHMQGEESQIVSTSTPPPTTRARRTPLLTVVTDSELQTWDACPQLHHFRYRERLRPLVAAKALAVGSIFHAGMSAGIVAGWSTLASSLSVDGRVAIQTSAATESIDDLVGKWAGKIVAHSQGEVDYENLAAEVDETARMVKFMLAHYFDQTRADLSTWKLVDAEHAFDVEMLDRRGKPVSHLRYVGVRDALWYDPTYNQLVLGEHKTCGGDPRAIERRVEMDTQTGGYLHAVREEMKARPYRTTDGQEVPRDASIGRVAYNVLRKTFPEPPKVNKDGSVSVAACTTTADMYAAALNAQVTERKIAVSEKQNAYLEALRAKGDPFFARVEWHKTDAEIERWRSDAFVKARQIREAERDPQCRVRKTGHCNMPWSLPCSYRSVCLDPTAPELRAQFRVASEIHTEVRAAQVDAEGAAQ